MLATLRLPRASARGGRFIFVCQLLENVISLVDFIDSTRESTPGQSDWQSAVGFLVAVSGLSLAGVSRRCAARVVRCGSLANRWCPSDSSHDGRR